MLNIVPAAAVGSQLTESDLPLSAADSFNRNGAARVAHSSAFG